MTVQSRIDCPDWKPDQVFDTPNHIADLRSGEFEVGFDDLSFACSLQIVPGADRLLVPMNPGDEAGYPAFLNVPAPGHCHMLRLADPSIPFSAARFSCFIGTETRDPVAGIIRIVAAVCADLKVDPRRVIFYGPSGGGFGALMCAARGQGAALAVNAQTDLGEPHFSRLGAVIFEAFRPEATGTELRALYPHRFCVAAALAQARAEGRWPRLLICQNSGDDAHYRFQYVSFCQALDVPFEGGLDPTGTLESVLFYQVGGHGGFWPERDVLREALARFTPIAPLSDPGASAPLRTAPSGPDSLLSVEGESGTLALSSYSEGWHRFIVPRSLCQVKLTSPTFSPAEADPASADTRRLGVAVEQIRLVVNDRLQAVNLASGLLGSGWHAEEAAAGYPWRWTDGAGVLFLPPGAELLEIATAQRWCPPIGANLRLMSDAACD